MNEDLPYQLALTDVPLIGHVQAKILAGQFATAREIFEAPASRLEMIEGIGKLRARSIKSYNNFESVAEEIDFLTRFNVRHFYINDESYPKKLLNCYDPPVLLFYKGSADLHHPKVISIVGTRGNTDYGRVATEKLIDELLRYNVMIISGLAFGIDTIAHQTSLRKGLTTVGVVAHGLDIIYPRENTALAKKMLANGGILTEFRSKTDPDKHNFPSRNRIIAGMSDATVVIETGIKGGSIITADIAHGYNRDVFAVPGRITDRKSAGCNFLIASHKATILQDPAQLPEIMGWAPPAAAARDPQCGLFGELDENERLIVGLFKDQASLAMDDIHLRANISSSLLSTTLLNLELKNVLRQLPGRIYSVVN